MRERAFAAWHHPAAASPVLFVGCSRPRDLAKFRPGDRFLLSCFFRCFVGSAPVSSQVWGIIGLFVAVEVVDMVAGRASHSSGQPVVQDGAVAPEPAPLILRGYGGYSGAGVFVACPSERFFEDDVEETYRVHQRWTDLVGRRSSLLRPCAWRLRPTP